MYIPRDFHSHQPKGFAFVEYANSKNAEEAKTEMDRFLIRGRELEVLFAQEKRKTPNEMRGRGSDDEDEDERTRGNGKDGGGGERGRGGGGERSRGGGGERGRGGGGERGGGGGGERRDGGGGDFNRSSSFERHKQREREQGGRGRGGGNGGNRRRSDGPPSESRYDDRRGPNSGNRSPPHHDRAETQPPHGNGHPLKMDHW